MVNEKLSLINGLKGVFRSHVSDRFKIAVLYCFNNFVYSSGSVFSFVELTKLSPESELDEVVIDCISSSKFISVSSWLT